MKTCKKCEVKQPLNEFYAHKGYSDDKRPVCKSCDKKRSKELHKQRKESGYYKTESYQQTRRAYRTNPGAKSKRRTADKLRYDTDPHFKVKVCLSARVRDAVMKGHKSDSTINLLGCTVAECVTHIESQFQEGMSWDNYGLHGWHIDHIQPCDSFDLSKESEQRKCFHFTNLQPLWAEDNLSKGSKV